MAASLVFTPKTSLTEKKLRWHHITYLIVMISSVIPEILVLYTIFEQFGPKSAHISPTKTRNVSAVCQLPASVKSNEQATLAFQKHNSATSHKDKITERRQLVWKF